MPVKSYVLGPCPADELPRFEMCNHAPHIQLIHAFVFADMIKRKLHQYLTPSITVRAAHQRVEAPVTYAVQIDVPSNEAGSVHAAETMCRRVPSCWDEEAKDKLSWYIEQNAQYRAVAAGTISVDDIPPKFRRLYSSKASSARAESALREPVTE